MVRREVWVISGYQGRREKGQAGGGGRARYADVFDGDMPERYAREAVRIAVMLLDAVPAPAGQLPVVLGPGWPGVLLHAAVGPGLEGEIGRASGRERVCW